MLEIDYKQVKAKDLKKYGKFIKKELYLKEGIHCLPRFEINSDKVFVVNNNQTLKENE